MWVSEFKLSLSETRMITLWVMISYCNKIFVYLLKDNCLLCTQLGKSFLYKIPHLKHKETSARLYCSMSQSCSEISSVAYCNGYQPFACAIQKILQILQVCNGSNFWQSSIMGAANCGRMSKLMFGVGRYVTIEMFWISVKLLYFVLGQLERRFDLITKTVIKVDWQLKVFCK